MTTPSTPPGGYFPASRKNRGTDPMIRTQLNRPLEPRPPGESPSLPSGRSRPVVFRVTFRAAHDASDPSAARRLRWCLKHALRSCQLKCIGVTRVGGGE